MVYRQTPEVMNSVWSSNPMSRRACGYADLRETISKFRLYYKIPILKCQT